MKAALCVVDDDPRLPKTRLHAKIPSIGVSVTEQKVLDALALATSIPLPESDTAPMALNKESLLVASSMSLKRYLDERQSKPKILENKQREISEDEITQYTDLEFSFELNGQWGGFFIWPFRFNSNSNAFEFCLIYRGINQNIQRL